MTATVLLAATLAGRRRFRPHTCGFVQRVSPFSTLGAFPAPKPPSGAVGGFGIFYKAEGTTRRKGRARYETEQTKFNLERSNS